MARSRPKIPFMMFQDVIMAVFGILILIVIYLLINAKVSDIEFAEALEEMRQEKVSLNDSLDAEDAQRKVLYDNAVKTIKNRETLELSKQVDANEAKMESFDREISSLLAEVEAKREDLNETISERFEKHPGVLSTRREVVEKRAEVEALEDAINTTKSDAENTERVIEKTESYMDDIKNQFRVELDESLAGESVYLVDFGGRQIRTFKVYDGEQTKVASRPPKDLLSNIKADPGKKRVFFFVRPDAVDQFNQTLVAFRESNIAVGYQPVPAGEELILTKFPDGVPSVDEDPGPGGGVVTNEQAGSKGAGDAVSAGGGRGSHGEATGGGGGSSAQQENQATASETAAHGSAGTETAGSPAASEDDHSEQASGEADGMESTEQGSEGETKEASSNDTQNFNWLILLLLVILMVVIIFLIKGSKR